jgi:urea transporter
VYCALLTGATEPQALAGLAGYNPALAALALSQVHRSALAPALGIALAIIYKLAFDQLDIPALTMPFILACWTVALGTRLLQRQLETQTV